MTTRRDLLRGAAVAVPAAALGGAGLALADPKARLAAAIEELQGAMLAVWPGSQIKLIEMPEEEWQGRRFNPAIWLVAKLPPRTEG